MLKAKRAAELEKEKEIAEKQVKEMKESFKKAEKSYYKAMDDLPNGWDMIGMNVNISSILLQHNNVD